MEVGATISLDTGHAYVTLQPWVRNNTPEAQPYQLWLNAMLAFNNNTVSGATQLIVPSGEVLVHTSDDPGLPGGGATIPWPSYSGRDLSWYSNWQGYFGFFVPNPAAGFIGVYDHQLNQGIVRSFNPGWPAGTKFFGPARMDPAYWTDDSSNYLELWSGATSSFWSHATLDSGQSFSWTEFWYPVRGMGGLSYANRAAALRLDEQTGEIRVAAAVSATVNGHITLFWGGQVMADWPVTLHPGTAFTAVVARPLDSAAAAGLRLTQNDGSVIAQTGVVP
jgi:hypothetical protein